MIDAVMGFILFKRGEKIQVTYYPSFIQNFFASQTGKKPLTTLRLDNLYNAQEFENELLEARDATLLFTEVLETDGISKSTEIYQLHGVDEDTYIMFKRQYVVPFTLVEMPRNLPGPDDNLKLMLSDLNYGMIQGMNRDLSVIGSVTIVSSMFLREVKLEFDEIYGLTPLTPRSNKDLQELVEMVENQKIEKDLLQTL